MISLKTYLEIWLQDLSSFQSQMLLKRALLQLEYQGCWGRCWVDMGSCDSFAIDILINSLMQINEGVVEMEELLIGGMNEDWPIEDHPDSIFTTTD